MSKMLRTMSSCSGSAGPRCLIDGIRTDRSRTFQDPRRRSFMTANVPAKGTPHVIILGAGMSGILAGIKMRDEGIESFEILEMGESVGGNCRDSTYPGLSC